MKVRMLLLMYAWKRKEEEETDKHTSSRTAAFAQHLLLVRVKLHKELKEAGAVNGLRDVHNPVIVASVLLTAMRRISNLRTKTAEKRTSECSYRTETA